MTTGVRCMAQIIKRAEIPNALVLTANSQEYFRVTDVTRSIGYSSAVRNDKLRSWGCSLIKLSELVPDKQHQRTLTQQSNQLGLSYTGLVASTVFTDYTGYQLIVSSSQRKSGAISLQEQLNIPVTRKCIQAQVEHILVAYFKQHQVEYVFEYTVRTSQFTFRIDIVLPKFMLAIEVDENNHRDRDSVYEQVRQQTLESHGYTFLRMDPHAGTDLHALTSKFWECHIAPILNILPCNMHVDVMTDTVTYTHKVVGDETVTCDAVQDINMIPVVEPITSVHSPLAITTPTTLNICNPVSNQVTCRDSPTIASDIQLVLCIFVLQVWYMVYMDCIKRLLNIHIGR